MSAEPAKRDVSGQTDIASALRKNDATGAFQRNVSSFRNFIEKDGKFAPESGKLSHVCLLM